MLGEVSPKFSEFEGRYLHSLDRNLFTTRPSLLLLVVGAMMTFCLFGYCGNRVEGSLPLHTGEERRKRRGGGGEEKVVVGGCLWCCFVDG